MSGGHYNYKYYTIHNLADEIELDFINDGKKKSEYEEDREYDYLTDANDNQKKEILNEVNSLIDTLRKCGSRAKELEWFMSGDTGVTSYLERLSKL